MKLAMTALITLMLGGIGFLVSSCAAGQSPAAGAQDTQVTVGRGDITVDITASGNLALSVKEDLAFDIPGTVEEVLVVEGDTVTKDQVLARLDTSEWDKQLTALEKAVTTARRQVTATQKALRDKHTSVITSQNQLTSKQFALRQAELDLRSAEDAVTQIAEVKRIQDQIDSLETQLQFIGSVNTDNAAFRADMRADIQQLLQQLENEKKALLAGAGSTVSPNVALDIEKKQLAVKQKQLGIVQSQFDVDNARLAVDDAKNAIAPAEEDVRTAQDDLATAQKNLDQAKSYGPEVKAPFDGFVTKVNVKGGDDVKKGTAAVTVADPNKFEADVLVNETDIANVRLGGLAAVELQSSPGAILSANVTHISPTATVQQGVVNYKVTVEVGDMKPAVTGRPGGAVINTGNVSPETLAGMRRAFAGGNMTREQIDQLRQEMQQAGGGQFFARGPGGAALTPEQIDQLRQQRQQFPSGSSGSRSQLTGKAPPADVKLAEGMTVNVSIPVESRANVIVVPNSAIATKGGQTSVKVRKADGTVEERVIQTGISDYTNTEVMAGLSEGETVVITKKTSTGTGSTQSSQIRMPSGGAMFREARP